VIPESTSGAVIDGNDAAVDITPSNWITVFPTLELTGISANIMANCELISATKDTLSFLLAREQSAVFSEEAPRKIAPAFEKLLGKKVAVEITIGDTTGETPAARKIRLNQEMQAKRIRDFENDWPVLELKKKFGGRVVIESIVESVVGNAIESVANNEAEERR
jgi:DNA polymerase-3 subunit gamma/tau